jgi:hypothetical protein
VPEYVKNDRSEIIPESVQKTCLRLTTDAGVFDVLNPDYDPLAVQLGVVYISTALDVKDIALFDTRRRGGGVADSKNVEEVARLVNDASSYWDVNYGAGHSYQRGGYVIIRLPEELRYDEDANPTGMREEDIRAVIERNITSGVAFKLENLQGRNWS